MLGSPLRLLVRVGLLSSVMTTATAHGAQPAAQASGKAPADEDESPPQPSPPGGDSPGAATPTPAAAATTFESLARSAVPTADLGTLLAPFAGKCDGEKRELDRVRCRSTRAYLRKVIPRRSFSTIVDDPAVITVSEFDGAIKGYHLSVAGCLACTRPVLIGRTNEARLITLKTPVKDAESLRAGVEVSRNSVGFDSLAEAKTWLEQSRPQLRTQFVFQPADTEWTYGGQRGYAMTLLGARVFNRCTGEILISRPPSTGTVDLPAALDEGCRQRASTRSNGSTGDATTANTAAAELPAQLSKNDINEGMNAVRPRVFACFEKFKVPGLAQFDFVVAGNGTVNSVRLSGTFFGTPTGACLLDAAKDAHFPRFSRERQQFVYPFFLRQ